MKIALIGILSFCLLGCESDLKINTVDFTPQPIVYFIINQLDSIHNIRIERSFSPIQDPQISGNVEDSLYFKSNDIIVELVDNNEDTLEITNFEVVASAKDTGAFMNKEHRVYQFKRNLSYFDSPIYKSIRLIVSNNQIETAIAESQFLPKPLILWPRKAQQYIYMDSTRPFIIQWYGGEWNEVDICMTVNEQVNNNIDKVYINFEKTTNVEIMEGYYQISVPYEFVVSKIAQSIDGRKKVDKRFLGPVLVTIHSGNKDFRDYKKYVNGFNDFNNETYSNIENGIGVIACKWTWDIRPLQFDLFTRQRISQAPELRNLHFIEY